ncbi:MAG: NAD(P)-dependent oxidoreductase [Rhizobiaceae bacterium]|nr:NAD(P)-dependent oxidoreductase [Rhizobiaceae bacterium]
MSEQVKVGLIGLGMMGKPMALRILGGGYPLTVFDVRPEPIKELVDAGATSAGSPKEVAERCDVILTSLPTIKACEAVYFGDTGLLKGARKGQVLVETSTVPPHIVRRVADEAEKLGVGAIDAALLSRTKFHPGLSQLKSFEVVAKGQLTVMIGGKPEDIEKARPVLSTFADPLFEMGPIGSGVLIKVLNAALTHAYFAIACEVMAVARKSGIDLRKLEEIFRNTSAYSGALNNNMPHYLETGKGKMMSIESAIKDSEAILEVARELNIPLLMQSVNHAYYEMALQKGGSRESAWDGELMKLWEGFIGQDMRFDQ